MGPGTPAGERSPKSTGLQQSCRTSPRAVTGDRPGPNAADPRQTLQTTRKALTSLAQSVYSHARD